MNNTVQDGRIDFDFFVGEWKIYNRKLKERLNKSNQWTEFEGITTCRKILDDLGNIDDGIMNIESDKFHFMTLRIFNPNTQEWSLYWSDSRIGFLTIPMIGKFENGIGHFYALDTHNDQHIFSRFIWSDITPTSCHWEQAFSVDGGQTWETNWTMDMVRQ